MYCSELQRTTHHLVQKIDVADCHGASANLSPGTVAEHGHQRYVIEHVSMAAMTVYRQLRGEAAGTQSSTTVRTLMMRGISVRCVGYDMG